MFWCFFFSSRRRHTRSLCDWSSDVCSSDLVEGAAAQRRALDFEPDFVPAQRELAEDLLRLGQNDAGWELAESAHKKDAYDVTAYNLSMLHERMEKFATLTNEHFIVHMSPLEAGLYGDRV